MTTSSYLEHYLDTLESLPGKLRRNFTLMLEMDEKNMNILKEVDSASDGYLRKVRDLSPDSRKVEMDKIQRMFKKAKEYGDEKVSIAIQTYEMVDKDIRRLDADLAKFEAEMREKGAAAESFLKILVHLKFFAKLFRGWPDFFLVRSVDSGSRS